MPFDPNIPQANTEIDAVQMRGQLNGLKSLIDLIQSIIGAVVDAVTTVNPGDPAMVTVTIIANELHFTFAIPRGNDGAQGVPGNDGGQGIPGTNGTNGIDGAPGEVTNAALATAISGTSNNSNAVATLDTPFGDPDSEALRAKMNEFLLAARR